MALLSRRAAMPAGGVVVLVSTALMVGPSLALRRVSDPSPWLHLKVGEWLLDGHRFGRPDPWAPFATQPFVPTQWLPSVITAKGYDSFGTPFLAWERAAGITLLSLILLAWLTTIARPWVAVAASTLAVYAAWPSLTERPQLAGFVLLVPVLAAWWSTAQDCRPRWWLAPLTWLAASTHGIWATGGVVGVLVTTGLVVSRRATRVQVVRLVALLAACATAGALTPIGPRLLLTPFEVGSQGRHFVQEWLPSSVRDPHVAAALLMLSLAWLAWVRSGRKVPLAEMGLLVLGIALTLTMQRTVTVGALIATPLLASAVEATLRRRVAGHRASTSRSSFLVWGGAAAIGLIIAIPVAAARDTSPTNVPFALAPDLKALPVATRILVDGDTSGWVLFVAPQLSPVFDNRIEVYSADHVQRYIGAMSAEPGWQRFIANTGSTTALLKDSSPISAALVDELHWKRVNTGAGLVLLVAPR